MRYASLLKIIYKYIRPYSCDAASRIYLVSIAALTEISTYLLPAKTQKMSQDQGSQGADAASSELFTFSLYHYTPSLPAAILSVAIFAILTATHAWRMHRAGSLYFTPFTIGGLCMYISQHAYPTLSSIYCYISECLQ